MTPRISALMRHLVLTLLLLMAGGSSARAEQALHVFFAEAPALLVRVDGDPVYAPIPGTALARITNTKVFIVRDPAGIFYLRLRDGWMQSYELKGQWSVSGVSPFGENTAADHVVAVAAGDQTALLGIGRTPPTIFVVTKPAGLVVTDGPPRYATVPGTKLQFLTNTSAKVFREPTDLELYVGVDGQWYRAWTIDGSWEFVAASDLPRDIAIEIER